MRELRHLVAAGMTPSAALQAATGTSARALHLDGALGRLVPGMRADLIAVQGAPDRDLAALSEVRHVVIDGVVQNLARPWYACLLLAASMAWAWVTD